MPFKKYLPCLMIGVLPFLMFHWMLPFISDLAPGLDYIRYHVWPQLELMFAIHTGTFPLYYPCITGGMPSTAGIGLAQGYLPFPWLLSLLPGYGAGYALPWNILLDLFTLAAAHAALFVFLRRVNLTVGLAFFISMTTVYSPHIQISFLHGAALGTWVGHIFLCSAIGLYYLKPTRWKGPLFIVAAAYWLINSGNPGDVYYGMLTAVLFTLFLPYCISLNGSGKGYAFKINALFWARTGACIAVAILLSSAYLLPLYADTIRKVWFPRQPYETISYFVETPVGLISNFFLPLRSLFAASFGGTPLYLAIMLMPVLILFRFKIPKFIWMIWVLAIIIGLHALGPLTPIHRLAWEYLPLATSIRAPTRICMMLPILFMLPLVWLFLEGPAAGKNPGKSPPLFLLATGALTLTLAYILIVPDTVKLDLDHGALLNLRGIPPWAEPLSTTLGLATLAMAALYGIHRRIRDKAALLLCLAGVLQVIFLLKYGSMFVKRIEPNDLRTYAGIAAEKNNTTLTFPEYLYPFGQFAHMDVVAQIENYMLEPHLGKIYRSWISAASRDAAYAVLNRSRTADQVVVEAYPEPPLPSDTVTRTAPLPDAVHLTYSSYNRLVFSAQAVWPSVFATSLAHTGYWRAWVNGKKVPIYRANGYACAVSIPAGQSTVEFRYWSDASFWGMAVSCAALALIGAAVGILGIKTRTGYITAGLITAASLALFFLWYGSLYSGKSFNTRYAWETPPADAPRNMAFGKPARMSSGSTSHIHSHRSRSAVDGDTSFFSCFVTNLEESPTWEVDLQEIKTIDTIVIHTSLQGDVYDKVLLYTPTGTRPVWRKGVLIYQKYPEMFNRLPLVAAISTDHAYWDVFMLHEIDTQTPLRLKLETPKPARYVRIIASGTSRLCLNEVEVYGPPPRKGPATLGTETR